MTAPKMPQRWTPHREGNFAFWEGVLSGSNAKSQDLVLSRECACLCPTPGQELAPCIQNSQGWAQSPPSSHCCLSSSRQTLICSLFSLSNVAGAASHCMLEVPGQGAWFFPVKNRECNGLGGAVGLELNCRGSNSGLATSCPCLCLLVYEARMVTHGAM